MPDSAQSDTPIVSRPALPARDEESVWVRGLGRGPFAALAGLAFALWFAWLGVADANLIVIITGGLVLTGGMAVAAQLRLINMGYNPRLAWLMFVPGINVWLAIRCVMYPPGHSQRKSLDSDGWKILGILVLGVILINLAGWLVAMYVVGPEAP